MVIKGKSRGSATQAASYLNDKGKNEKVRLIGTKGTVSQDISGSVQEMAAIAALSRCKKFLYHASINPKEGEHLTEEQWQQAVERLEKNLGLDDHQRVVVEHTKDGRTHRHILWNRVDQETFKAVHMSHNYAKHERTARELEKEFGLDHVQGVHVFEKGTEPGKEHGPTHKEGYQAKKKGVNLRKWRKDIRELAAKAEGMSGADLVQLLESQGHMVALGDKVPFVILDPSGTPQRMAQSLGVKVKDLKERLADIGPVATVEEAQQKQKDVLVQKAQEKEQEQKKRELLEARKHRKDLGMYSRGGMAAQQEDALRHVKDKAKLREEIQRKEQERIERAKQQAEAKQWQSRQGAMQDDIINIYMPSPSQGKEQAREKEHEQIRKQEEERKKEGKIQDMQRPQRSKQPTQAQSKETEHRARTEQTDSKRRRSRRDAMKEIFDKYKPSRSDTEDRSRGGGGRERER